MNSLSGLFWARLGLAALADHAATEDLLFYSDRFPNGWGDRWSWMPRHARNDPEHSGTNSVALVPSGQWLKSGAKLDPSIYTNLRFWLNGSA